MQSRKHRIKVCYVITKGVWGGAQKYVYTLATSLPEDKYDVVVITGIGGILKNKLEEKGIKTYEISSLKRDVSIADEIKSFLSLFKIIWKEHPDVLHLNSPKASGLGAVAGRLTGVPKIIQTVHGWSFNEKRNIFSKFLIFLSSGLTVILCHKTIVIAEKEKKQALSMPFVDNKKIKLIRNGIEPIKYIDKSIVREALLGRVGEINLGKSVWLGTISELHKNKGLEYSIKAVSKIRTPVVFFILGGGEEKDKLESLVKESNLQDKVFLVGFIDNANLYLKAFDIFLLTSTKEGLPYTILEAGQAGLPVVASNIGGIPDIIDDGINGILTKKGDVFQIIKATEYFISNPDIRKEFGKNLKEKVEKEFSVDGMIKKILQLYKS